MKYNDGGEWETHTEKFQELLGKLSSYDFAVKEEDKTLKLLCTLPESFAPLAMVAQTNDLSLERVIAAVEGDLSRRKLKTAKEVPSSNPISSNLTCAVGTDTTPINFFTASTAQEVVGLSGEGYSTQYQGHVVVEGDITVQQTTNIKHGLFQTANLQFKTEIPDGIFQGTSQDY